jgi:Zn-dependent protease with chaperone function/tetratricopeptide (TPR) repeat protein
VRSAQRTRRRRFILLLLPLVVLLILALFMLRGIFRSPVPAPTTARLQVGRELDEVLPLEAASLLRNAQPIVEGGNLKGRASRHRSPCPKRLPMTAILLSLLIAQPPPDEVSRTVKHLAAQLGEANRLTKDDPEGALHLLDALLGDPTARELAGRSRIVSAYREHALYSRGQLQLQQGQAQAVADEMTALLDAKKNLFLSRVARLVGSLAAPLPHAPLTAVLTFPPEAPLSRMDCYRALVLRAAAYKELERHDEEQADRAEAEEILHALGRGMPATSDQPATPRSTDLAWRENDPRILVPWVRGSLVVGTVFVVMIPVFFLTGMRQRREASGSWRRLFWVSLALAALQTAPVLTAVLLTLLRPGFYISELPVAALFVFSINIARHCSYLKAVKWVHARGAPPLLEDAAVLRRIAELSGGMGISPPVTRLVRSAAALQTNNALIAGLAAPTLVLFDGVLYRLTEEERDAIIAHELAHLANHTFWYWLLAGCLCSVAVVATSPFYPLVVALGLGLALWTGTWLILSRRLELDCDRRAARALGHRRAASALWKLHADQKFHGVIGFLLGAVSTHPSRDERLAAIRQDAPRDDMPEVEWDARVLRRRRLAAWGAFGLWLLVIVGCLVWARYSPRSDWPALPLALMSVIPSMLLWLGLRQNTRPQRRLQRTRPKWRVRLAWLAPALMVSFLAAQGFGLAALHLNPLASLAILVGGFLVSVALALALVRDRAKTLNHRIVVAIQSGDYPKALTLCEGSPAVVAGSTELRYNHALIRAVLGRRNEALSDLERLRRDDPGFKMTLLLLASLYADEGEYARALEAAVQLSHDLPNEPAGPQAEALLLRKLGRLDEAETRARAVLKMEPRSGQAHLTLAGVALDRGDPAGAREYLAQAERLTPGSMMAALLTAELALGTEEGAESAVNRAVQAARNNPLSFADKEVASLVQRLEARRQAVPQVAVRDHVSTEVPEDASPQAGRE